MNKAWLGRLAILLAVTVGALAVAVQAGASHGNQELLTTGPNGGNGAYDVIFGGTSEDGTHVFWTTQEKLVAADTDDSLDVYEWFNGVTDLVSQGQNSFNAPIDAIYNGSSRDGTHVYITTTEPLTTDDTDSNYDVFERFNGTTTRLSQGPSGGNAAQDSFFGGNSDDGSRVYFNSYEKLVPEDNDTSRKDVYLRQGGTTTLISTGPTFSNATFGAEFRGVSSDGARVFFDTDENLVAADTDGNARDIYERQPASGTTTLVSAPPSGASGNFRAFYDGISDDGTHAFIHTQEALLPGDTDTANDIYERTDSGFTEVSVGPNGGNGAYGAGWGGVSTDGSKVWFTTAEPMVASDTDGGCPDATGLPTLLCSDVYERSGGTTTQISTPGNGTANASFQGASTTGSHVFFATTEPIDPADTDAQSDVYDRSNGVTTRLSYGPAGGNGDYTADFVAASQDGTRVFFQTFESLVSGDTDSNWNDVYERTAGVTTLISTGPTDPDGPQFALYDGGTLDASRVYFETADPLVAGDLDARQDIYRASIATGGFPRPKGATPMIAALVPAYTQCTSPNSTHGAPLASPSCNPPVMESSSLTIGSPDANGVAAGAVGSVRFDTIAGTPSTPQNEADVKMKITIKDVRNRVGLTDYLGKLLGVVPLRLTDKGSGGPGTDPATASDLDFEIPVQCVATGDTIGAQCTTDTTANAQLPGSVIELKRSIWEIGQVRVMDAGPNGTGYDTGCPPACGDGDEQVYLREGIFIP